MAERILTLRELNRATLARQFLLERTSLTPLAVIQRLVALQGQMSNAPYIGLWTRLQRFERAELTSLLENREVVRASSIRGTLHIMSAEDYLLIHPVLQPTLGRNLHTFARQTEGFAMDRFVAEIQAYLQEQPRTGVELRAKMEELYPGMGQKQIEDAVRMYLALIQIPPAGTWGFTGKPAYTSASTWLGRSIVDAETNVQQMVLRYLAAFGPASIKDIQKWSGLNGLRHTIEVLRPELVTFRDERGRELFDLPDAPRPSEDTPVPVRFLPDFDNLLLSYAEHGRVMAATYQPSVFTINGLIRATFLVDGFVQGLWRVERTQTSTTLVIEPFESLTSQVRDEVYEEEKRLLTWLGGEMTEVRFTGDC